MLTKNEMSKRADELNVIAAKGDPLPDGLTSPEQLYFLSLRQIYRDYRSGALELEQAKTEKLKAVDAYMDNMFNYQLYEHQAKLENVFSKEFYKEGTVCQKSGDCRLYRILCGLQPKEESEP